MTETVPGIPHRGARIAGLCVYVIICYSALTVMLTSALATDFVLIFGVLLFAGAIPFWFALQLWAKHSAEYVEPVVVVGDPLAALDETEAGKGEKKQDLGGVGQGRTDSVPLADISPPRPEPLSIPAKYVKVTWQRTQKLEGYLPVENVKVVEQNDTGVEVVKEGLRE